MSRRSLSSGLLLAALLAACNGAPSSQALSFKRLPDIAGVASTVPHLARASDGRVVMSWLEPDGDLMALRAATLRDGTWQTPVTVATGDDWFINWADFPSVQPIDATLWAAHWLVKTPGTAYSYDVAIAISSDAGESWSAPVTPHDDGTASEHGFVSLFPWQGAIGALWLDGRNTAGERHGGMTLRSAVIDRDGAVGSPQLIDELVCDCCQTDVALGPNGPIAVYRNRNDDEIRDIHVVRAVNGEWHSNRPVADDGWQIAACPVNGPAIVSNGPTVAVAWFTAANNDTQLRMAWSSDHGETFEAPIDIDIDRPVGRVDIEILDDGSAVVSWLRTAENNRGEICVRQVAPSGQLGPVQVVVNTGASRASGFPQILRDGSNLIIAWTDVAEESTQVLTTSVDVTTLLSANATD